MALLQSKNTVALWLTDPGARAFLGIVEQLGPSRWTVLATFLEDAALGMWVHVKRVHRWRHSGNPNGWEPAEEIDVTPADLLIRWDFIISIQLIDKFEDLKVLGFKAQV